MWDAKISRRRFLALSGSAAAATLLPRAFAQAATVEDRQLLRIGAVLPTTGDPTLGTFGNPVPLGQAANRGASMAADLILGNAGPAASTFKAVISSAPDTQSMLRAATRMVKHEGAYAVVGGFTTGDAAALSQLADQLGFIFLNVAAPSDSLRLNAAGGNTFHLAASTTMYLTALLQLGQESGYQRWFVVQDDNDEQRANLQTLQGMSQVAGSIVVNENEPYYGATFQAIAQAQPDLVLLLLSPNEQLTFAAQYRGAGLAAQTLGLSSPMTQTRRFYASYLQNLPGLESATHISSWDATLTEGGAAELNLRFLGRTGLAMDPTAWAAYVGVRMLADAAVAADSVNSADLAAYLLSAGFDVQKGTPATFRAADHQLLQPLYLVRTYRAYQDKTSLLDLARVEREFDVGG